MAHKWRDIRKSRSPEREAKIQEQVKQDVERIALSLGKLRQARELTQTQLADALDIPQNAVSKAERRADMYISTLRRYIEALGGQLEIRAMFPDAEIVIEQFGEAIAERKSAGQRVA